MNIEYDEMPTIKIHYNNSKDVFSKIDRMVITNKFKDDFRFPYKGYSEGTSVIFKVYDNNNKEAKVVLDFEDYDGGYFDIILKYNNLLVVIADIKIKYFLYRTYFKNYATKMKSSEILYQL